jgi:hypothetical protein
MRKIPKREEVTFNSCKSKDGCTLAFDLEIDESNGGDTIKYSFKSEFPVAPHPDLTNRINKLKPRLLESFGWSVLKKLGDTTEFAASAAQKKYLQGALESIEDNIRVTGVQYFGKGNTGATVKGLYDGSPINTKIYFTNQDYGEDMEQLIEEIGNEVYEFVYKNKHQQLQAFDD